MEEDDDFYGDDSTSAVKQDEPANGNEEVKDERMDESLEEGEEEEEDSSDSVRQHHCSVESKWPLSNKPSRILKSLPRAKMCQHLNPPRMYYILSRHK